MSLTVEYACEDGSPFAVTFADAEDAARTWHLEQEHSTGPMSPLAADVDRLGRPGCERAYTEAGLPVPSSWRAGPSANGFPYFVSELPQGEEMAALFSGVGVLVERYGSALGIWRDFSLPKVRAVCDWLRDAPPDVPVARLAEEHAYAQHHTMVSSMVTWNDMNLVTAVCQGLYGDGAELVAYELSQGHENETIAANRELHAVAVLTRSDPQLARAMTEDDPGAALDGLRHAGAHVRYFDALDRFLGAYGWRSEAWSIDTPTWCELGEGFWSQVRQLARPDAPTPDDVLARAADRREQLIAEIDGRLASDPDAQARFHRRVERLAGYVPVREDRAMWQLIATGSLRHALLRRGRALVAAGALEAASDVFYAQPTEIEDPPTDLRARVELRRADHERWRAVLPPLTVGGPAATREARGPSGGVLTGIPASRGVVTGVARVITGLGDADRLQPGEVLVCPMTSPPWTPLFALAAALVTDAGDIGSHPSIAAREFGIPCVVGTGRATLAIADGAKVTVDGAAGTVTLLG